MANAGYSGTPDNAKIKLKDNSGVPEGTVKTLTLTGAQNCCGACAKAIKGAVGEVEGVKEVDVAPKAADLTITGDFNAQDVIKALNAAGLHAKVKK